MRRQSGQGHNRDESFAPLHILSKGCLLFKWTNFSHDLLFLAFIVHISSCWAVYRIDLLHNKQAPREMEHFLTWKGRTTTRVLGWNCEGLEPVKPWLSEAALDLQACLSRDYGRIKMGVSKVNCEGGSWGGFTGLWKVEVMRGAVPCEYAPHCAQRLCVLLWGRQVAARCYICLPKD